MINNDLLLKGHTAKKLYNIAKELPIIDYHNHLSLAEIQMNKRFTDVYDLWIKPDPYKHRAMRMCGVEEHYITGIASNEEKFIKWCETIPRLIGNPLYHWSFMELKTVFDISDMLSKENALEIYKYCNRFLVENIVTTETILNHFNVEYACPCASIIDNIAVFENNSLLSPSLRGDDIVNPTVEFIKNLKRITQIEIADLDSFKSAVIKRLDYFKECGCVFSDHALDNGFRFFEDDGNNSERFSSLLKNTLDDENKEKLFVHLLLFLGREYSKRNFVMQLHIGAKRYTSSKLRNKVGPAGGFAGIGNSVDVCSLTKFLDTLDRNEYGLPKTILFTLNPSDNALISVLSGSYIKDGVKGLVTQGPAWWWCDHKKGIEDMLENTSTFSVLSNFIGMTTDSRSFLSFVRHDYFRRVLCNWIGEKIDSGEFICFEQQIEKLICDLCYGNANREIKNRRSEK